MKDKWNVLEECNDDDGNPTCWAIKINNKKYGKFIWITETVSKNDTVEYAIEADINGEFRTLITCKSLTSAKRWVTMNILNK